MLHHHFQKVTAHLNLTSGVAVQETRWQKFKKVELRGEYSVSGRDPPHRSHMVLLKKPPAATRACVQSVT